MLKFFYYTMPKYGNSNDENEDAIEYYSLPNHPNAGSKSQSSFFPPTNDVSEIRCAIADGATQTSFSKTWAKVLVKNSIKYIPSRKRLWNDVIQKAQNEWRTELAKYELPWHAEEKVKKGAFSTLLWVSIKNHRGFKRPGGKLKAIAIGDSNMIIVRNNAVLQAFPISKSMEFGNNPYLLSSRDSGNDPIYPHIKYKESEWLPGDLFLLATDALAEYILKQFEDGNDPLLEINNIITKDSPSDFENWIDYLRKSHLIHNDDTTLASILSS